MGKLYLTLQFDDMETQTAYNSAHYRQQLDLRQNEWEPDMVYRTLFQIPVFATTTVGDEPELNVLTKFSKTCSILSKTTSLNSKHTTTD